MRNYRRKCIGSDRYNERRSDRVAAVSHLSLHVLRAVAACNLILSSRPHCRRIRSKERGKGGDTAHCHPPSFRISDMSTRPGNRALIR